MGEDVLRMLADAASALIRLDAGRVRATLATDEGFDREIWTEMAAQGWLSILVPEALGGLGLGVSTAAVVARRLGYANHPEPFAASGALALTCVAAADDPDLWNERLASLMSGERVASVAWQGEDGGIELADTRVVANLSDVDIRLSGLARLVPVPSADAFIVLAQESVGPALFWVDRHAPGLSISAERSADGSPSGRVSFDGVALMAKDRLADGTILEDAIDLTLVVASAELLGLLERALEMTLEYLRTRVQFGVPIGSFQALQHRAVDMWIQGQLSEAALQAAIAVFENGTASRHDKAIAASGAKARAAQAALFVCKHAVQLHGAIGFADEYGLGLCLNRALTLSAWLGNSTQHRRRFAALSASKPHHGEAQ